MTDRQVALVTGGSRGIGEGIVAGLSRLGYCVAINYRRSADRADRLARGIVDAGGQAWTIQADISNPNDRARMVDELESKAGRIDLLVNNAGMAPAVRADILEASEASFDEIIATNLKGPYFLTQAIANWMIALGGQIDDYRPKIVFITSVSAQLASINRGDYCLSKAALSMAVKLFALRLGEADIGVYELRPGITATDMTAGVKEKYDKLIGEGLVPQGRWGRPEDVARVVEAIAGDLLSFSTGAVINVDGGLTLERL